MSKSVAAGLAGLTFREDVRPSDAGLVRDIVESTGFFNAEEVDVAVELVDEALAKGSAAGYFFVFAVLGGKTEGYACYGPIPGTKSSFDLYWIAVRSGLRGRGLGRAIMERAETAVREMGGARIYIDTSSREQYTPTRGFYESCGYNSDAVLDDFYAPGDSKVVYVKKLKA
jgi:GNAT superfamily N-acetyltransferase